VQTSRITGPSISRVIFINQGILPILSREENPPNDWECSKGCGKRNTCTSKIRKLCSHDRGNYLVKVFHSEPVKIGLPLLDHVVYKIDMELCVENLEDKVKSQTVTVSQLMNNLTNECDPEFKMTSIQLANAINDLLPILEQILRGIHFIHEQGEVEAGKWLPPRCPRH